jgi:hypothetical protein
VNGNLVPLASVFADVVVAVVPVACATAASRTVVVSEIVSRSGERPSRMVAGATIVIERVTGVCVPVVVALGVVVAMGVAAGAVVAVLVVAALPVDGGASALC